MSDVPWIGIEHEFVVRDADGTQIDFRDVIDALDLGRRWLDPADVHARRLPSGAVVTCDDREAEIALPPVAMGAGFVAECVTRAAVERDSLAARLAPLTMDGASTHVSVSGTSDDRCRLLVSRCAPALMLVADRRDSPGVLVRPRPGRTEVGVEYAAGSTLAALVALTAGLGLAAIDDLRALPATGLPVEDTYARFGWFVRGREVLAAGDHPALAASWSLARRVLVERGASEDDLVAADRMVAGALPRPCRSPIDEPVIGVDVGPSAFGRVLEPRRRRGFDVAPVMATWHLHVLVAARGRRRAFVAVRDRALATFVDDLDGGVLDDRIRRHLRRPRVRRRVLTDPEQVDGVDVFDHLGPRRGLLVRERPPVV